MNKIKEMIEFPDNKIFIGGEWVKGKGAEITSFFPASKAVNTVINGASNVDLELAIERASKAQPLWEVLKPHERARVLIRISDELEANRDKIALLQTYDTGKTLKETTALAISAANTFRYFAAVIETLEDKITPSRGDYLTFSTHEALGVVGAITPWNSPIASDAQKVAPALAAGNAVILKPSSWSPLVSLLFASICEKAGLPKGLLSILPGSGAEIGEGLVKHAAIKKVSFTGGTKTGKGIGRLAGEKLMPVSLELGGKSPTIVFKDCDMKQALAGVLFGIFSSSGQSCIAGSRLFVEESIYKEFVGKLVEATKKLNVGHPLDTLTHVAPLIRENHLHSVLSYKKIAKNEGGKLLTGEEVVSKDGYYFAPTIIEGLNNQSKTAREEIFGPVLMVMPFKNEQDLIEQANDNDYGLAAGIWTADFPKAWRLAKALMAGTIWVNSYKIFSISTPFGGFKDAGLGREKGIEGVRGWQAQKSIYVDLSGQPFPYAAGVL